MPDEPVTPAGVQEAMRGFIRTAILRAGVELRVFDALAAGPVDTATLADRLGLHPRGARLLLGALAAIGLLRSDPTGYRLADGADVLTEGHPLGLGGIVRVACSDWEWEAMGRLADSARRGGPVLDTDAETPDFGYWTDFATHTTPFTAPAADLLAGVVAGRAAAADPVAVLDVACGHGVYGLAVAERLPAARLWQLDWPSVLPIALARAADRGLADRVRQIPGDMFTVPPGGPYDLVLVTNVLHHFSAERAGELLARYRETLAPGGRVALVGFVVDERTPPADDPRPHLFSLLMLAMTAEGETHSIATYRRILTEAGYAGVEVHAREGLPLQVITADRG